MGRIIKNLKIYGDKGEVVVPVLLDSGATVSVVREDIAKKICKYVTPLKFKQVFRGANGKAQLLSKHSCVLQLKMKNYVLIGQFYISKATARCHPELVSGSCDLSREVIIGADFMQKWDIKLDPKKEDFTIGINPNKIEIV